MTSSHHTNASAPSFIALPVGRAADADSAQASPSASCESVEVTEQSSAHEKNAGQHIGLSGNKLDEHGRRQGVVEDSGEQDESVAVKVSPEEVVCKYCLEQEPCTELFHPCQCTNPVHTSCLRRWLTGTWHNCALMKCYDRST